MPVSIHDRVGRTHRGWELGGSLAATGGGLLRRICDLPGGSGSGERPPGDCRMVGFQLSVTGQPLSTV